MGFSLPRKRLAARAATRPRTWSAASMTHQLRCTSLALAEKVFMASILGKRAGKLGGAFRGVNALIEILRAPQPAPPRKRFYGSCRPGFLGNNAPPVASPLPSALMTDFEQLVD